MPKIRIGTRDSQLALWQAQLVSNQLRMHQVESILVPIKSEGDVDTVTPLYAMGVQGIFTRSLDAAVLKGEVDIAVHSMKDVPVTLAKGLAQVAVLPRGTPKDIFVISENYSFTEVGPESLHNHLRNHVVTIATSSIRRKAQWLAKYPHHHIENLRGNVNTRLAKVHSSKWAGAVFAAAGLERLSLRPAASMDLDWMLPAPAQGAIMIVARETDQQAREAAGLLDHHPTSTAAKIERDFLSALMGGCSSPIGAYCREVENGWLLQGNLTSADGSKTVSVQMEATQDQCQRLGQMAADALLQKGGSELLSKNG